jgi:hypothetical protein
MADSIDTLSKLTGISKPSMLQIWEEVQANHKRLDECEGPHDFSIKKDPDRKIGSDWICTKCGGRISAPNKTWYERGLAHGHKDR